MASRDQEDEHSCFSDNTHRDAVANAQGIQNVWLGSYKRLDGSELKGPGLRDWVAAHDKAVAEKPPCRLQSLWLQPMPFPHHLTKPSKGHATVLHVPRFKPPLMH